MYLKRLLDLTLSITGLLLLGWFILIITFIASIDTNCKGIFKQTRIGQYGKPFKIYKIRTMHPRSGYISSYGRFLRNYKLDELPQLINILIGQMSFVGPRPDIAGYYDHLQGENRKLLELKPGLCSMAALKYYNEEALLVQQENPIKYNDEVIFPDKISLNLEYYDNRSIKEDLRIFTVCLFKICNLGFKR